MNFAQLRNRLARQIGLRKPVLGADLINAVLLAKSSATQETEQYKVETDRDLSRIGGGVKEIEQVLKDSDMILQTKFVQTQLDAVSRSGSTKQSLLNISKGSSTFTPEDMSIGRSYRAEVYLNSGYDSYKPFSFFLSVGDQEVQIDVPIMATGLVVDALSYMAFDLHFTSGPDTARTCYFLGYYTIIDIDGVGFTGAYFHRVPYTVLTVDATVNQPFDIQFQGTDAANTCEAIDLRMWRS